MTVLGQTRCVGHERTDAVAALHLTRPVFADPTMSAARALVYRPAIDACDSVIVPVSAAEHGERVGFLGG